LRNPGNPNKDIVWKNKGASIKEELKFKRLFKKEEIIVARHARYR
jgi:hypothetical protein